MNEWSKKPPMEAVSMDKHGACILLQLALQRGTRIFLFFSSGSGLTLEGPQGQTYAMARILQLCNSLQFKQGERSQIEKVIFPQPLIPSLERPDVLRGPLYNIPKYELECANAARLLSLNSSTADKKLDTFISSTESVGMDYNLTCNDPIRQALPFNVMTRLRGIPNPTQSAIATKIHLPNKMTWPAEDRSFMGALTLKTLAEYSACVHVDALHALNDKIYPVPQVDKLIKLRLPFQNIQSSVQRWNDEIVNCTSESDRTCVNLIKHREVKVFASKELHERHTIACYGHVATKSAPPVVLGEVDLERALPHLGPGDRGRGRHRRH